MFSITNLGLLGTFVLKLKQIQVVELVSDQPKVESLPVACYQKLIGWTRRSYCVKTGHRRKKKRRAVFSPGKNRYEII